MLNLLSPFLNHVLLSVNPVDAEYLIKLLPLEAKQENARSYIKSLGSKVDSIQRDKYNSESEQKNQD